MAEASRAAVGGGAARRQRDGQAVPVSDAAAYWPHDVSHEPAMKIGEVVEMLRRAFPALSISKVRYLESEGLVRPYRVGNGYRRYSAADVERLRFALTCQRDEYLPLSVIRERLSERDSQPAQARPRVVAVEGRRVDLAADAVTAAQLCEQVGLEPGQLDELEAIGLVSADNRGRYSPVARRVAGLAAAVHASGVPLRNLRSLRLAAQRSADLVEQAGAAARHRGDPGADERAATLARQLGELHAVLLQREVDAQH